MESLTAKCFSITGKYQNREEVEHNLLMKGLHFSSDINNKVGFLVVANDPKQGKITEARLKGVPLVMPQILEDILRNELKCIDSYRINSEVDCKKRKRHSLGSIFPALVSPKRNKSTSTKLKDDPDMPNRYIRTNSNLFPKKEVKSAESVPKSKVIALEGNIGVGKSTLCNKFERSFPELCAAYKEQTNELFLKLFYSDPKKYGFAFQWGMLKSRIYQLQLAQHDSKHPENPPRQFYFWDRSMMGDYMFALWNHLLGGISREEMNVYESEFGGSFKNLSKIPFLKDINCFVFLNDEPAQCKFRVEQHRKNDSEQGIPLSYYEGIDDMHFNIFMRLLKDEVGPTAIFNWGEYHDTNKTISVIKEVTENRMKTPTVKDITFSELSYVSKSEKVFIYTKSKEMKDNYDELKEMSEIQDLKDKRDIYIPKDIMKISAKDKGIIENDYQLDFYKNEYKRVVLYHLSRFQNIFFYSGPSDESN